MLVWGPRPRRRRWRLRRFRSADVAVLRWGCLSVLALLVAFMAGGLSPRDARGADAAYVDTDALNLRADAGTWANVLDVMWQGAAVDVLDGPTDDGWYQVSYDGQVGWAYGGYLAIGGAPGWDPWPGDGGVGGGGAPAWVATDRLNLRSGASLEAEVLDVLTAGDQLTVTGGERNGFVPVVARGVSAWVWSGYLSYGGPVEIGPERWIDVNRSTQTVSLMVGEEAIAAYPASLGWDTSDDGFYATANGTYYVFAMNANLTYTPWANAYIIDWVAFDPSRENGFHGWTMDENGNVLPNGAGKTGGCVALEPWAADELYAFATIGMRVEVHW